MSLLVAGVSHHTADIAVRERIAPAAAEVAPLLEALRSATGAHEALLLSTCNRTEFYVVESGERRATGEVWSLLSRRLGEGRDAAEYGYVRRDREAVAHLFRVAAGMESMILGEAQIQGQVRDAWEAGREHSGLILNRLFQSAMLAAGRVRAETSLGRGAASVSSAAVRLAKKIFGSLAGRGVLVLGAGEVAELALGALAKEGVRNVFLTSRTGERADALAERAGARGIPYADRWRFVADVDIMLCSTSAPQVIVTAAELREATAARGDRPLCVLDLALPRNVESAAASLANVYLYDLDDLRSVVEASIGRREDELPAAESLILEEAERYWQWLASLAAVPVVARVRESMEQLRARELDQALRHLGSLSPSQREGIELFSRSLMNKFLHEPSVRLRAAAANGRGLAVVDAARYLFAVDDVPSSRGTGGESAEAV